MTCRAIAWFYSHTTSKKEQSAVVWRRCRGRERKKEEEEKRGKGRGGEGEEGLKEEVGNGERD